MMFRMRLPSREEADTLPGPPAPPGPAPGSCCPSSPGRALSVRSTTSLMPDPPPPEETGPGGPFRGGAGGRRGRPSGGWSRSPGPARRRGWAGRWSWSPASGAGRPWGVPGTEPGHGAIAPSAALREPCPARLRRQGGLSPRGSCVSITEQRHFTKGSKEQPVAAYHRISSVQTSETTESTKHHRVN